MAPVAAATNAATPIKEGAYEPRGTLRADLAALGWCLPAERPRELALVFWEDLR